MPADLTHHVLVVDSDPEVAALAVSTLTGAGYQVKTVVSGQRALEALSANNFQIVLADIGVLMPDGQPLLRAIREHARLADTPVLALIGAQPIERHLLTDEPRADDYLSKPFQPRELLRRVANTLDLHRIRQSVVAEREVHQRLSRQLVELNTLSAIGQSLASELDLDKLLTRVAEAAASLTHAEESLLLLWDEETRELYMRAQKGVDSRTAESFRIKSADSQAFRVFESGAPLLIDSQAGWQKIKTEYLVKSMLYVPLSIQGQNIGVLGVNNRISDRNFTTHDMDLLMALAGHVAIAIYNARLYRESEERRRELRTLIEIGRAVSSTLALDQVLETITAQVMRIFNAGWCFIFNWDSGDALHALAEKRQAVWQPDLAPRLDPAAFPALHGTLRHARWHAVHADDAEADAADVERVRDQGVASCLYLPLRTGSGVVGVVEFRYHERAGAFHADAVHRLQNQALPIAFLIAEGNYTRRADELLRLTGELMRAAEADWCSVRRWDEALAQLVYVCALGSAVWPDAPPQALDLRQAPALAEALTEQTPISATVRDAAPNVAAASLLKHTGGQALLGVPLVIKGRTAGMLLLIDTLYSRQFSRREEMLARGIADQAALAIENARLFRELERSMADLRQAQSSLVIAARLSAMGELAAAVAHQINNPLTTVLGDAELLLHDLPRDNPSYESAAAIYRAGQRAHEVVRRLLGMARNESDEGGKPTDVNATIRNVLALAERHIARSGVTLRVTLADSLPPVDAVPNQLEDVWLNLLLNARDAVSENQGEIGIESRLLAGGGKQAVEVAVWDNGPGVAPENQERIFDPFFTTKAAGEGTGLGLYICRQVVDRSHGNIRVESAPGQGSRFTVTLPVSARWEWTGP
ncbi:MAG: hypothetical protein Kow00120_24060 [Anaerolineae bacterium]